MTELKQTLYEFWAGFDMPAYQAELVQDGAKLPYITYEVVRPPAMSVLPLTAFAWFPRSVDGNMRRTAWMDAVEIAIPESGLLLPVEGEGYIKLERNTSGFLRDYQDPEDNTIIGARVSYLVRFYF